MGSLNVFIVLTKIHALKNRKQVQQKPKIVESLFPFKLEKNILVVYRGRHHLFAASAIVTYIRYN